MTELLPNYTAGRWQSGKGPGAVLKDPVLGRDLVRVDAVAGTLDVLIDATEWATREHASMPPDLIAANGVGLGRELFAGMRHNALTAEEGACTWL